MAGLADCEKLFLTLTSATVIEISGDHTQLYRMLKKTVLLTRPALGTPRRVFAPEGRSERRGDA